jgi:hypothetical protein
MAVQLGTAPTQDDVRWLREQALRAEWEDEGFFEGAMAFVTQRGPRERIRAYLDARADDSAAELSAEDQATLQQWLDERPAPTAEQLRELAAARLALVESVLHDKGIDAARVSHTEPPAEAAEGKPVVSLQLRALRRTEPSGGSQSGALPRTDTEETHHQDTKAPREMKIAEPECILGSIAFPLVPWCLGGEILLQPTQAEEDMSC